MLLADQIKQATSPAQGLLLLAQAIDRVNARLDELEDGDPMGQPLDWGEMAAAQRDVNAATAQVIEAKHAVNEIAEVRAALATVTDEDERKVLNARLYLLKNPGSIPPQPVEEGKRTRMEEDDVVFTVTEERMERRRAFARQLTLWDFLGPAMDEETAVEAFAKGGPLWLYHGGARDAIMQMPYEARQWMCTDVGEDSPAEAQELALDLLKQKDSVPEASALESLERAMEKLNA